MPAWPLQDSLARVERVLARPSSAVDRGIAAGARAFIADLRASIARGGACPYTITSRRYSVWSLIQAHLDEPFAAFVAESDDAAVWRRLTGVRLSCLHKIAPDRFVGGVQGLPAPANNSRFESALVAIDQWREYIRAVVRGVCVRRDGPLRAIEADALRDTLDFLWADLLLIVRLLLPRRQRPRIDDQLDNWKQHTRELHEFCELCWRPTEYARYQGHQREGDVADTLNKRFCSEHNPSDPRSRYRVDHRYKRAFTRECLHQERLGSSEYAVEFALPAKTTTTARRKVAYDLVHAGFHSPDAGRKHAQSLKERVYALKLQGMTQSDIARKLGVSRQAVSKACMKVREILARQQAAQTVTADIPDFQPESMLVKLVATMEKQGRDVAAVVTGGGKMDTRRVH